MKVDVLHIAKLANLPLTKDEAKKYEEQLSSILDYVEKLQEVDTESVTETSQTTNLENVLRIDVTSPSLSQEQALANTKVQHNRLFKVKGILEQ